MVIVEAEIGWDGRLLAPPRVTGSQGSTAGDAAQLLAAGAVDELRLTLVPRLGGPNDGSGTLTNGTPFPAGSTAWELAEMRRLAGGRRRLRYVRALPFPPLPVA